MQWIVLATALILSPIASGFAAEPRASTADHGTFEELNQPFASGPDVTRACLKCHTEAAKQLHSTKHWTWEYTNPETGQLLGKKHVVNNFCIAATPNIASCSSCHISFGWKDDSFDFTSEENVDCLVCHDSTGTYTKNPKSKKPNLTKVARAIGPTSRASCGSCHFKGGGGEAVKHGDLDSTLNSPDIFVDVHMDADGLDFTCSTCHTADQHALAGSRYAPLASDSHGIDIPGKSTGGRASCQSCHNDRPHKTNERLNDHTDRLACQTCHIPEYSRGDFASKEWWDWSKAGELNSDNTPLSRFDADGHEIYNSKKGDFIWRSKVRPEYVWFNGTVLYTLPEDRIDPTKVVDVNRFQGDASDPKARIWPVKIMRGKQPYDTENLTLATPLTVSKEGLWTTFDWASSLTKGMAASGLPYSGKFGFVETRMFWPINHMVAPKESAVKCDECHAKEGRLKGVEGVFLPGRDSNWWLDMGGIAMLIMTTLGVLGHGLLRYVMRRRHEKEGRS